MAASMAAFPGKAVPFKRKTLTEIREERKEDKVEKIKFEEKDFPSLNPEAGKQNQPCRPIGTPPRLWENPPSAKQPSKMLVIKKILKEEPAAAFSVAFTTSGSHHANGNEVSTMVPTVYKNLVPKPALHLSKSPSSTTPPIEISSSRLTKLTRQTTDRKNEFLKTLKVEQNGDCSESRDCDKLEELKLEGSHIPEPQENGEQGCLQNGLSLPMGEEGEVLPHSLEAEHRLLKAMGLQEYPGKDERCLPLTEDELKEFHVRREQLGRNRFGKNGFLQSHRSSLFSLWRSTTCIAECEDSDTEMLPPGRRNINAHS